MNSEYGDHVGSGLFQSQEKSSDSPTSSSASTALLLSDPTSTAFFV
jgi:hypothetical protein